MIVNSVQMGYRNQTNLTFNSWHREVRKMTLEGEKIIHRNDTWFFRNPELWPKLVDFFVEEFKNVQKVNVYNYACSNGSEPYTFVMQMLSSFPQEASKFFPVIAKDYDEEAIKRAKNNEYHVIGNQEIENINYYTGNNFSTYFNVIDEMHSAKFAYPSQKLCENVEFSLADINSDYKKIQPDNTIVFVRNFWPYIENWWDRQKLLNKLFDRLGENSFIVIGQFDREGTNWTIDNQVIEAGFRRTNVDFVYEKPHVEKQNNLITSICNRLF